MFLIGKGDHGYKHMANGGIMKNVTAIIPAYNEEQAIGKVLECLKKVDSIGKIIVVSDGSTDKTVDIAKVYDVDVIELSKNIGKGGAIKVGVNECETEIILFLDADLVGLKEEHVVGLIQPVIDNEVDMTIGIFKKGRRVTDLAQKVAPCLSGQRVIRKSIIDRMPNIDVTRYGVEVALTKYVNKFNIKVKEVYLEDMTHITKEEKLGILRGVKARLKMYWDIVKIFSSFNIRK